MNSQFTLYENNISWKSYYYPVDNFLKYDQQQEEDTLLTVWSFHWKKSIQMADQNNHLSEQPTPIIQSISHKQSLSEKPPPKRYTK